MHKCSKCGEWEAEYNYKDKSFKCTACGHVEPVVSRIAHCPYCGKQYVEYTWYDPSSCKYCNRTFVD